jgi:hypothetical protein
MREICEGNILGVKYEPVLEGEPRNKAEFVAGFVHAMAAGELLKQELRPLGFYDLTEEPKVKK